MGINMVRYLSLKIRLIRHGSYIVAENRMSSGCYRVAAFSIVTIPSITGAADRKTKNLDSVLNDISS